MLPKAFSATSFIRCRRRAEGIHFSLMMAARNSPLLGEAMSEPHGCLRMGFRFLKRHRGSSPTSTTKGLAARLGTERRTASAGISPRARSRGMARSPQGNWTPPRNSSARDFPKNGPLLEKETERDEDYSPLFLTAILFWKSTFLSKENFRKVLLYGSVMKCCGN